MKNLKRVLSLALSGVMLVGMMAVSAGAVNGKDFVDADEIKHTEAVNTLVTLNVINGKDDGSHYDPNGTLTRAEMAKLIVYVLNGGSEPVMSTKATPTYSDIKGHWAEKYIEYCSNLKIVAGQGDGTFNPGGTLTGSQAAKMMLVAMSYDSNVFGFTGADWELNVNSEANKAGLYDELKGMDPSTEISRDAAAQMVYNGMLANTMKLTYSQSVSDGKITQNYDLVGAPLFSQKFDGTSYEGVLVASGKWTMNDSITNNKDNFKVNVVKQDGVELETAKKKDMPFKWADQDLTDLAGEYVRVLYNNSKKTVYGVYAVADMNTVVKTTSDKVSDLKTDSIKIDGDTYDIADSFTYTLTPNVADTVKFVDNDGDGSFDLVITTPVSVHKVTFASSTSFTLDAGKGTYADKITSLTNKLADVTAYDDLAKNDIVLVYEDDYTAKVVVEKAEIAKDVNVESRNTKSGKFNLDGAWYNNQSGTAIELGNTIEFYAIGGVVYYAKIASGSTDLTSVAMVVSYGGEDGLNGDKVRLLFSDNSIDTVTAGDIEKPKDGTDPVEYEEALLGTDIKPGDLVVFEVDGSKYNLKVLEDVGSYKVVEDLDLKDSDNKTTGKANNVDGTVISDDAVVFFLKGKTDKAYSTNTGKVMTGKEIKSALVTDCGTLAAAMTKKSNGLNRTVALALSAEAYPGTTSFANYGYIVADPLKTKVDGKNYITYKVWDGETTETYKAEGTEVKAGFGEVIGYETADNGIIKSVTKVDLASAAVSGLDKNDIQFTGIESAAGTAAKVENDKTYTLDGNTKYLYVDSGAEEDEAIGQADGSVALAANPDDDIYVKNVLVQADGSKIKLIVVDVNGKIALQSTEKGKLTITDSKSLIEGGKATVSVDGAAQTETAENVVKPGDAVVISNTDEAEAPITLYYKVGEETGTIAAGKSATVYVDGADLTIVLSSETIA